MNNEVKKEIESLIQNPQFTKIEEGYSIPKNYFTDLQNSVIASNIERPVANQNWWERFWSILLQPRLQIAFATLSVMAIGFFFLFPKQSSDFTFASISEAELDQYIDDNIGDFDENLFINLVEITEDEAILDINFEEDIDSYLEENIDLFEAEELIDHI